MAYKLNFVKVGTPTIVNHVASGFTYNSYLTTSNFLNVNNITSFEVITAFKYVNQSSNFSRYKCILEANDGTAKGLRFVLTNEEQRKLFYRIEDEAQGLEIKLYGTTEIVSGTKYYSKITYDSVSGYKVYLSTNGSTWTLEAENSSTDLPLQTAGDFCIGNNYAHNDFMIFEGEIYLNEWSATVNNEVVWTPYELLAGNTIVVPSGTVVRYTVSKSGYGTETGTLTVTTDQTINVILPEPQEIDVSDYEYTLENGILTLTKYVGAGGAVDVPNVS